MPDNDSNRWNYEAQIGINLNFLSYLHAYQTAFKILYAQIGEGNAPVNIISYPLLFLARHSLELGYKFNINYLAKYSHRKDKVNWNYHHLRELHDAFGLHFRGVVQKLNISKDIADEFNSRFAEVEKLTETFNKIDRGSFNFRYPVDTEQRNVFEHRATINLLDVKELYEKAMILVSHTADVLSDFTDYVDDMNQLLEEEHFNNDNA